MALGNVSWNTCNKSGFIAPSFINQDQRRRNTFLFGLFNQDIPVS